VASLVLAASGQAACLPLDDLSSYSSAWERPASGAVDDDALDASTGAGERGDSGTTANGAGLPSDASARLASPDASPGEPAPDAAEPAISSNDGGSALDAGAADATP
jgi:hypothetical protein